MQSELGAAQPLSELLAQHGGSIKTGPFGTTLKASEYAATGVPLISVREIGHGSFYIDAKTPRVSADTVSRLPEYVLEEGDIVFARKGGIERCALIRKQQAGWFLGSDGIRLRPPKVCDARYLAYALQTPAVKDWLVQHSTGSTMASLNQSTIGRLPIALPVLPIQRSVADTLEAFDARIDLLRQTNGTLESLAQALFKSWFVDFDPVRAKAEERKPEGMDAATAALFPADFEESALGLIPKGWTYRAAGELFDVGIGKTPPRKEAQWFSKGSGDVPWLSIKDMGDEGAIASRSSEFLSHAAVAKFNVRLVPSHTVLMSFKLTVGRLSITDGSMCTNEAIAHFKAQAGSPPFTYLYCYLKAFDFRSLGSTSSIADATNSKAVKALPVLVPSPEVLAAFRDAVGALFQRMFAQKAQWRALEDLRDTLLPRLVSGKLRIPEAQARAEEALA